MSASSTTNADTVSDLQVDDNRKFFEKPPLVPPYTINENTIFIAIDPNGGASASGASGSETAIVSFIVSSGRVVIVGLDAHPTQTPEQPRQMLYAHIDALRAQPCFARCKLMLIPEANYGDQAQIMSQIMLRRSARGLCDAEIMCQYSHCYGIYTSPGDPERYVLRAREKLAEDGFFLHDTIVSTNPYANKPKSEILADTLREFKRQMSSFRAIYIVPTSLQARVRMVYSGKADKDNKRSNRSKDDMCMALLFGYFYYTQFMAPHALVTSKNSQGMFHIDASADAMHRLGRRRDDDLPQRAGSKRTID